MIFVFSAGDALMNDAAIEVATLACMDDVRALTALAGLLWEVGSSDRKTWGAAAVEIDCDEKIIVAERHFLAAVRAVASDTRSAREAAADIVRGEGRRRAEAVGGD